MQVGVPGNATALAWHHRLNQIFVGLGACVLLLNRELRCVVRCFAEENGGFCSVRKEMQLTSVT